jgi:hypothetical protein
MQTSDSWHDGLRLVISEPDGQYWVLSDSPLLSQYTWEAFTRQGDQLSGVYHVVDPISGKLGGADLVRLSVAKVPGQLLFREDGTGWWQPWHATLTKVSDSTVPPTPVSNVPTANVPTPSNTPNDPFVGTWRGHGEPWVISKHDGQYTLLEHAPGSTPWEVTRQGDQLSADLPLMNPNKKDRLADVWWVRLSVTKVPGQLLYRWDGTDMRTTVQGTLTKVSDSTTTPRPAP